eukprot:IDg21699t1
MSANMLAHRAIRLLLLALVQAADAVAKMLPRPSSHLHPNAKAHTTRPTRSLLPIGYANRTAFLKRPSTESLSRVQHDVLVIALSADLCTLSLMACSIDN